MAVEAAVVVVDTKGAEEPVGPLPLAAALPLLTAEHSVQPLPRAALHLALGQAHPQHLHLRLPLVVPLRPQAV